MEHTCFNDPNWYRGITLTERITSLDNFNDPIPNVQWDVGLANRRMQYWQSQSAFTSISYFEQRLRMDGISEDEFLRVLGEPIEAVHHRFATPPAWLVEFAGAFSQPAHSNSMSSSDTSYDQSILGFLNAIEPLISKGRNRLGREIQALVRTQADLAFDPATVDDVLFANLPRRLVEMLSRTMALELNVARIRCLLDGDTPEARFRSFLRRLRERDRALAILQEYPVLARQLTMCIDRWVTASLEFLQRLCSDWKTICATFSPQGDAGLLVAVIGDLGDEHRGGRSVLVAKFSSGLQVVYKPRSLALDVHFQDLLAWANERGEHAPFPILKILNRSAYGWVQFVAAQGCTSSEEIRRFYQRQGGYLALLYALEAVDFHFENLITNGEYPVLIDLETLFHPRVSGNDPKQVNQLASNALNYSVLRVGLLPQRVWSNAKSAGVDMSGLGAVAGQLMPYEVPRWEASGTDQMCFARKREVTRAGENRPKLNGADVNVLDYAEAIAEGFSRTYHLLLKYRDNMLSQDGPIARFSEDEVRAIIRPTQIYGVLLRDGYHPDVLRDALDRDRLFDWLWGSVESFPYLSDVITAEREDLLHGDIPIFTTLPESRHLWTSSNERIVDFFDEPSLTRVRRRVEQLSDDDLARQLWFIRASLATLEVGVDRGQWATRLLIEPHVVADHKGLLGAARAVGDRLDALALRDENNVNWIGLTPINGDYWTLAPLGLDLYGGLPGVTLFLAYLGAVTGENRYTALAEITLTTILCQVERDRSLITSIGGFTGWGGLMYTLAHLGTLWNQSALFSEAADIVNQLPNLIENDKEFDIIGGAAGCIASLISLYRCTPSDRTLAAAVQCGDRLIGCAQGMAHGIAWVTPAGGTKPLAGFSHGAAGIASALLELAALTGEARFRAAALDAIAYERSLFSSEVGNWPDLRELKTANTAADSQAHFLTAWCHGASGIGLARLRSLEHLDDALVRSEIATALQTTLDKGFGGNHSLCHGDLGNLELLLQADQVLDHSRWHAEVNRMAAIILESISQSGWLCGTPMGVESPGLMAGLAGIGYELLRLAEPTHVPSVLMLEPPTRSRVSTECPHRADALARQGKR
jgi:type 2 lantibiotic biosynthesis protein LanM